MAEIASSRRRPDLILANGNVLDPAAGIAGELDVAIHGGRITEIASGLARAFPDRVLDVSGACVFPGLVDIHTHCFWGGTYFGIRPDPIAGSTGVTTWVDAGSSGAWNLAAFRALAESSKMKIRAYVNISAVGLVARTGELDNLEYINEDDLEAVVEAHRDFIVGIKVRMGHLKHGIMPLERAIAAGEKVGLPVMVHIRNGPPDIRAVLAILRPGDVLTHCFTGADMALVADELWIPEAHKARRRGVLFDVAHGGASFGWKSAEAGFAAGFIPDMISSDLHQLNYFPPNVDLAETMSKMLHLGMGLPEIVRAVTSTPARAIQMQDQVGTLRPGAAADIAVFKVEEGEFSMTDTHGESRTAKRKLKHILTIADGEPLPHHIPDRPAPYLTIKDPSIRGTQGLINAHRHGLYAQGCC
jgi:dihydroorotase